MHSKKEIGARVRVARVRSGLSQSDLGEKLEKDRSGVSKLESGGAWLSVVEAVAISELTGCSPAWLLLGDDYSSDLSKALEKEDEDALRMVRSLRAAVAEECGFPVTVEQAIQWVTKKAGIQEAVFPDETAR